MNSIIGVFDNIRSGIRYYSLQMEKDIGGEKIDLSSFYVKYKGERDGFKSSDKKLSFWKPILIPKGKNVYVNIYDSRIFFATLPTLIISKLLGKKIIAIVHSTKPGKKFINFKENNILDKLVPYWIFDSFIVHTKARPKTEKPVQHRKLTIYHEKIGLTKKMCREKLNISQNNEITLFIGYVRKSKKLGKFIEKFIEKSGENETLLIAGYFWDEIKIPKNKKIEVRNEKFTDDKIAMYIKASDKVAIPYSREESAVAYLAELYNKKIVS